MQGARTTSAPPSLPARKAGNGAVPPASSTGATSRQVLQKKLDSVPAGGGQGASAGKPRLPLVISAKRGTWRMNDSDHESADKSFQESRKRILIRDDYTCQGCGFKTHKWQEVHHLNDDHSDNSDDNLVTVCSLCHMTFHIGRAGAMQEVRLIWLPEMSQADLNIAVRTIFVANRMGGPAAEVGQQVYGALLNREGVLEEVLGSKAPEVLGETLLLLPQAAYDRRAEALEGVRLLWTGRKIMGNKDIGGDLIGYWANRKSGGPYGGLPPKTWPALFEPHAERVWNHLKKALASES